MHFFEKIERSLLFKVAITLGLSLFVFIAGYGFFKYILHKNNKITEAVQNEELANAVRAVIKVKTDWYNRILIDYACFDWMINFVTKPILKEALQNITPPNSLGVDVMQIYNLNRKNIYSVFSYSQSDTIVIPSNIFDTLYKIKHLTYYTFHNNNLIQIVGSTIHYSDDIERKGVPHGFIFVSKLIDSAYLNDIEYLTNCHAYLHKNNIHDNEICLNEIVINSFDSIEIAHISVNKKNNFLKGQAQINTYFDIFFILFCAILMTVIYHTNAIFVLKPLKNIEDALHGKIESVIKLINKKDEFGEISKLIVDFKEQRNKLENQNKEILKQNSEITKQKMSIERQNDEITDSIRYASIIQHAVLVPSVELSSIFNEHFVMFQPKNIVSGDFYWFKNKGHKLIIVGADCTGHGLSGALLSMLGISFLNEIVSQLDEEELHANEVLNSLRTFLIDSLHQTGEIGEVQDGMNVVLCIYDYLNCNLEYSGAYNPLYIVTDNNTGNFQLTEYKGDNMPVGIYAKTNSFTNNNIDIKKGDILYIASDGFSDQFGGSDAKKFRSKNFKQLLLDNAQYPLKIQKENIQLTFQNWRGNLDQVDDVMVLGFKI